MTDSRDRTGERESALPRRGAARTAKLASLPLGIASRAVGGWGKRLTGQNAEQVNAVLSAKAAEQLFEVLGTLKGGAMKFGQALSVFEAAVPDDLAKPYREALTKLQSAAPPMSARQTHRVLAEQLGRSWAGRFAHFDDEPAASASIGQVHRATWHDGREVAVKVQYPGADEALRSDLRQLQRFSRLFQAFVPGTDVKPLLSELAERMDEELDYLAEADHQRAFAKAFEGDPAFLIPRVVASAPKVVVTEWATGMPLAQIIAGGDKRTRDLAGRLLAEFHYSSPARVHLLHSDPHPGNFMLTADGRLCVIDFGGVAKLPNGIPRQLGEMTRLALDGHSDELMRLLRESGFVRAGAELSPAEVLSYLAPFTEPLATATFHFTRRWMQRQAGRLGDTRGPDFRVGRSLNLPPEYLMIHRVTAGSTGILCQLDADIPARGIVERWQPGFAA
ncbi:putative unusual protein kinase regulating ubiquinone biosynthesis (AarF/ABC1/UbiB family) [Amycolatopsis sulphurea]|uniref:Putative unusual protein kinase regulating ubiquinone biosynthesis (AarF/ABC1/UbiB family) n=1 Tax=Amycolatopsis sulphurea TaxID=76022 RepID=A0A2A9F753_9PSEU|nr:AarF/ABC1/UbiB kinase family protein [Amycolatopsis sulphurea]PFG47174.1 putative unusual protein kinase regulating ubiquinone biosynthesis (AarF/ABC1/UbiB family) [Amycolatopsis sulphurea]